MTDVNMQALRSEMFFTDFLRIWQKGEKMLCEYGSLVEHLFLA